MCDQQHSDAFAMEFFNTCITSSLECEISYRSVRRPEEMAGWLTRGACYGDALLLPPDSSWAVLHPVVEPYHFEAAIASSIRSSLLTLPRYTSGSSTFPGRTARQEVELLEVKPICGCAPRPAYRIKLLGWNPSGYTAAVGDRGASRLSGGFARPDGPHDRHDSPDNVEAHACKQRPRFAIVYVLQDAC